MSTVQMHYDGWLRLPDEVLQQLTITTGVRLDVAVIGMELVLRPVVQNEQAATSEPKGDEVKPEPEAAPKRRPGRPRKS